MRQVLDRDCLAPAKFLNKTAGRKRQYAENQRNVRRTVKA